MHALTRMTGKAPLPRLLLAACVCLLLAAPLSASAAGTASINGYVYKADGTTPVAGIEVHAWKLVLGNWQDYWQVTTLANGAYSLTGLTSGTYRVAFKDPAGNYVPEFWDDQPTLASATDIVLSSGGSQPGTNASMADAGKIRGTARDGAGNPVAGATVNAYRSLGGGSFDTTLPPSTTTAADGTYTLGGLTAGSYAVQFWGGAYAQDDYYSTVETRGVTAKANASLVDVDAGGTTSGIDGTLVHWGTAIGTVSSAGGPVNGAIVEFWRSEDASWAPQQSAGACQSAADGSFAIPGHLYPGRYHVRFTAFGFPPQYHRSTLDIRDARDVTVSENATAHIDAYLIATDTVAPVTTLSGVPAGWASNDIVASLAATDGALGSSVVRTFYTLGGGSPQTYAAPFTISTEGTRVLSYWSRDGFGNSETTHTATVRIDKTPPATSSDAAASYIGTAAIGLTRSDALSGVSVTRWVLDGTIEGTAVALSVPPSVHGLSGASHHLEFASVDRAGNVETTRAVDFTVIEPDLAAPSTVASGVPAGWVDSDVTVSLVATDGTGWGVARTWYRLNGAAPATYTAPLTISAEGTSTVTFGSVDLAGNREATHTATLRIDKTPPATSDDAPAGWQASVLPVHLTPADGGSGVAATYYALDGGPVTAFTGSILVTSDGVNTLSYWSVDAAGNVEAARAATIEVDTAAPVTTDDAPAAWTAVSPVSLSLDATDPTSGVAHTWYRIGGGAIETYAGPLSVSAEGTTSVEYWSADAAGNVEATREALVRIDTQPPSGSLALDFGDAYTATTTISVCSAMTDVSGIQMQMDGGLGFGGWETYSDVATVAVPAGDGTKTVTVAYRDEAGNTATGTASIYLDATGPDGTFAIDGGAAYTATTAVEIGSDLMRTVSMRVDAGTGTYGAWCSYAATMPITLPMGDGTKAVGVQYRGPSGIVITLQRLIALDTTPPVTSDDAPAGWSTGPVQLTLTPTDAVSGPAATWYDLDGSGLAPYTGPVVVSGDGTHTLEYRSADRAGNVEATRAATVLIDATPPVTTDDAPAGWSAGPVRVTLTPADAVSGLAATWYDLDGRGLAPYTGPVTVSGDGTHTLEYRSADRAGNVEATRAATVRIDATPPVTTDDAPAGWSTGPVRVTLTPADAVSGPAATWYDLDGRGLAPYTGPVTVSGDGTHTLEYRSADRAGNVEATRAATVRIDATPPVVTSDARPAYRNVARIRLTAADPLSGLASTWASIDGSAAVKTARPVVTAEGTHAVTFWALDTAGNRSADQSATFDVVPDVVYAEVSGPDRYGTAVQSSRRAFPAGAPVVVLATGRNWPDALGGGALAAAYGGPVLLTEPASLPGTISAEIARLHASTVFVLGSERAVSKSVSDALKRVGSVKTVRRIGGSDRYRTADLIAGAVVTKTGARPGRKALVATGLDFPDALAAAPLSAAKLWPLYLSGPAGLSAGTRSAMATQGIHGAVVLGSERAVPGPVATALTKSYGDVRRLQGATRYATAAAIAAYTIDEAGVGAGWDRLAVATGRDFPDALVGGVPQARAHAVVLLTEPASLSGPTVDVLAAHRRAVLHLTYLGSTRAVSSAVRRSVYAVLRPPL